MREQKKFAAGEAEVRLADKFYAAGVLEDAGSHCVAETVFYRLEEFFAGRLIQVHQLSTDEIEKLPDGNPLLKTFAPDFPIVVNEIFLVQLVQQFFGRGLRVLRARAEQAGKQV